MTQSNREIMKFDIKNRFTGEVQYSAEIECDKDVGYSVKLGLAVIAGYKKGADLRGVNLSGAKLRGVNLRGVCLSDADLTGVNLRGVNLSGAKLRGADLRGVCLSDADLTGADLRDADLCGADLRGADLDDAPIIKNIHKAVYEAASQPGALNMRDWHTCKTTHCRAGWVVTLPGEAGRKLEAKTDTPTAAILIYLKSDPHLERVPDFYASNKTALADMKRLAEKEGA